jgi:hypothetical protein
MHGATMKIMKAACSSDISERTITTHTAKTQKMTII